MRLVLMAVVAWCVSLQAEVMAGKVVAIADGDTVTVLVGREQVKVRLDGIDAPEKGQAYGERAREALAGMVMGKAVEVRWKTKDRYGRVMGRIAVGRVDVGGEMLRQGLAWWFRKYSKDAGYARLEEEAREARRGLWAEAEPAPPWEWRKAARR